MVTPAELRPADILLYQGTSTICRLLRLFDGTEYSHSTIYDGSKVLEAIFAGVELRDLSTSVEDPVSGATDVDVFRFLSNDRKPIGDPDYPAAPILARIAYYHAEHDRYAYEQLLLLSVLTTTRKVPIPPGIAIIIRNLLDEAADVLSKILAAGKQPMICSELVYRCYAEAGDKYAIRIRGADTARSQLMNQIAAYCAPSAASSTAIAQGSGELSEEEALAFLDRYFFAKGIDLSVPTTTGAHPLAVADFVTPGDLKKSPNLYKVGRLRV